MDNVRWKIIPGRGKGPCKAPCGRMPETGAAVAEAG